MFYIFTDPAGVRGGARGAFGDGTTVQSAKVRVEMKEIIMLVHAVCEFINHDRKKIIVLFMLLKRTNITAVRFSFLQ